MDKLNQTAALSSRIYNYCDDHSGEKTGLFFSTWCMNVEEKELVDGLIFSYNYDDWISLLIMEEKGKESISSTIHPRHSLLKETLIEIQRFTVNQEAIFTKKRTVLLLETQRKDVRIESSTEMKAGKLIEERHKCSNDVETNPGPQTVNFEELKIVVKFAPSKQKISKKRICQLIINMHEDAMNRKIPMMLYTENNLITIQNIWALSIRDKYQCEVRDKMDNLLRHFYDKVKEQEVRNKPMGKKQTHKKATPVATLKREAGTQFPEKLVNGVDESEDASTKENSEPILVSRELKTNVRKSLKK